MDGTSAGPHWNPNMEAHGRFTGSTPHHLGDIGNFEVTADGAGTLEMSSENWEIGSGTDKDSVGKAIIVHAGTDDFQSQPAGDAGSRVGCGVITVQ